MEAIFWRMLGDPMQPLLPTPAIRTGAKPPTRNPRTPDLNTRFSMLT